MLYASFITKHNDFTSFIEWICTLSCVFLYLLLRSLWIWKNSKNKLPIEGKRDDEHLIEGEELPIEDEKQDDYGFKTFAKIAADEIIRGIHGVGLLGGYGCGKSSFANLMRNYLKKREEVIFLKIDGWGLVEGGTVHYILNQIENELYKYADTVRINSVSREYQKVLLKQSEDRTLGLLSVFNSKKSTFQLIHELDEFLASIGKKIVLLLEDLDRNSNDHILFAEIGRFLDICKGQKNIYYIVTIAELNNTKTIIRCCGYHYFFQNISSMCIEPVNALTKIMLDIRLNSDTIQLFEDNSLDYSINIDNLVSNLAKLIDTPRKLKTVKGILIPRYKRLVGEIEFDDFMIITFLLVCKDDVGNNQKSGYVFLLENLQFIQDNLNNFSMDTYEAFSQKKSDSKEDTELDKIKSKMAKDNVPVNQQDLILILINSAANNQKGQRLLCNKYTNYWLYIMFGRFNIQGMSFDELSDQMILKEIEKINNHKCDIEKFIEWVSKYDSIAVKFNQFSDKLISNNTLWSITCKMFSMNIGSHQKNGLMDIFNVFLINFHHNDIDIQMENGTPLNNRWREFIQELLIKATCHGAG